ncbi:MAG: hypothetical protein IJ752_06260 [Alphaproteobacteria bacterium]|nr:hypothetical protein [Alphaproteobacteria bacterium]
MKKHLAALSTLCLLSACAGFKPDYVVKDASESSAPSWTVQSKAHKVDSSSEAKEHRYFVNDAHNVNQRLCLKAAETRATQKVASEVAQEIMSRFEEKSQSEDDTASTKLKDKLEQNIQVNLHGVAVAGKYWEKRSYLKEMGAEKDYTSYKCDVVVRIKKSALAEAIEAYKAKTMKTLAGEEKKAMTEAVDSYVADLKAGN